MVRSHHKGCEEAMTTLGGDITEERPPTAQGVLCARWHPGFRGATQANDVTAVRRHRCPGGTELTGFSICEKEGKPHGAEQTILCGPRPSLLSNDHFDLPPAGQARNGGASMSLSPPQLEKRKANGKSFLDIEKPKPENSWHAFPTSTGSCLLSGQRVPQQGQCHSSFRPSLLPACW